VHKNNSRRPLTKTQGIGIATIAIAVWNASIVPGISSDQLATIRSDAYRSVVLTGRIGYTFHYSNNNGLKGRADFVAKGDLFRLDNLTLEPDSAPGLAAKGSQTLWPRNFSESRNSFAFDGEHAQRLDLSIKSLRIEDGNMAASYGVRTPQMYTYWWLTSRAYKVHRWDQVVDPETWERRFSQATYLEQRELDSHPVQVVDFTDPEDSTCRWRVYFAMENDMLPIRHERRVIGTDEVSLAVVVEAVENMVVDGRNVGIPVSVTYTETGADGASRPEVTTVHIDVSTLVVNDAVEASSSFFTLKVPTDGTLYDNDELRRELNTTADYPGLSQPDSVAWWRRIVTLAATLIVIAATAIALRRRLNTMTNRRHGGG
jgi:hypothetical protein